MDVSSGRNRPTIDWGEIGSWVRNVYFDEYARTRRMALGIPERYTRRRHVPAWDGGKLGGRRSEPVWPGLARFLHERAVDVPSFIQAHFQLALPRIPNPNYLLTPDAMTSYSARLNQAVTSKKISLRSCRSAINAAEFVQQRLCDDISPDELRRRALFSERGRLSVLFLHLEAVRAGLEELAAATREAAASQYRLDRQAYNLAWPRDLLEPLRTVWPFAPQANRCIPIVHANLGLRS